MFSTYFTLKIIYLLSYCEFYTDEIGNPYKY